MGTVPLSVGSRVWDNVESVLRAEPVTIATLVAILLVRLWVRRMALQPVRRARRRWAFWNFPRSLLRSWRVWRLVRVLARAVRASSRSQSPIPAAVVAARMFDHASTVPGPSGLFARRTADGASTPRVSPERDVLWICQQALEPASTNLLTRYLLRDEWLETRDWLAVFTGYLRQFEDLLDVAPRIHEHGAPPFAASVSALTGAVVLCDGTAKRGSVIERVAVWHTGRWFGRDTRERPRTVGQVPRRWRAPFFRYRVAEPVESIGGYNGRVPVLLAAEVRQRADADGATLVLTIGESDYLSTEPLPRAERAGAGDAAGGYCKKLTPDAERADVRIDGLPGAGARIVVDGAGGSRPPLLNGKACLVSHEPGGERYFVLQNRTDLASNGAGLLGTTAGGVLEMAASHDQQDGAPDGTVDVLGGVRREMTEELGLAADDYTLAVSAVVLTNSRPRRQAAGAATVDPDVGNGESVATALCIGTTPLGRAAFEGRRVDASPSRGLWESRGSVFVPMGDDAATFAANLLGGRYRVDTSEYLGPDDPAVPPPAEERVVGLTLDHAALVGALYAAADVFGAGPTVAAFRAAMGDRPWWAQPWPEAARGHASRVVRDPALLGGTEVADEVRRLFADGGPGWPELLGPLRRDAAARNGTHPGGFDIVEELCESKSPDRPNEDRVVTGEGFGAVVDGNSSSDVCRDCGVAPGALAADAIAASLRGGGVGGGRAAVLERATAAVRAVARDHDVGEARLAASVAVHAHAAEEVWVVGDVRVLLDGRLVAGEGKLVDRVATAFRAAVHTAHEEGGTAADRLRSEDPGRAAIRPLLDVQDAFRNNPAAGPYAYGGVSTTDVPPDLVEIVDTTGAAEVVLASDGYPDPRGTLRESEERLRELVAADPLCVAENAGTKPVRPGASTFDDRAYLRVRRTS